MSKALFLPGAGGRKHFWQPVADLLDPSIESVVLGWPGFGDEPRDDSISNLSGLVSFVVKHIKEPVDLVAQSMGGVVAMALALRHPELIRRIVLTGTSGGIDMSQFGGEEWRIDSSLQLTPHWLIDDRSDLTSEIPSIQEPCLLIWGEDDTFSPPAVGRHLANLLPHSEFVSVPGGHDHPTTNPEATSTLINLFLTEQESILNDRLAQRREAKAMAR